MWYLKAFMLDGSLRGKGTRRMLHKQISSVGRNSRGLLSLVLSDTEVIPTASDTFAAVQFWRTIATLQLSTVLFSSVSRFML